MKTHDFSFLCTPPTKHCPGRAYGQILHYSPDQDCIAHHVHAKPGSGPWSSNRMHIIPTTIYTYVATSGMETDHVSAARDGDYNQLRGGVEPRDPK